MELCKKCREYFLEKFDKDSCPINNPAIHCHHDEERNIPWWFHNTYKAAHQEDKPKENCCGICGGEMIFIRSRYPRGDKRLVCPTCLKEILERIHDETSPHYGVAAECGLKL